MQIDLNIKKTLHTRGTSFQLDVQFSGDCQRIVIFGPSASGKTLTLTAIAGLLPPDSGHIRIGDTVFYDNTQNIDMPPQLRHVGYMFQDYALLPHLTVRQNVAFSRKTGWLNPRVHHHDAATEHWLKTFDLINAANQYPNTLSGGQKQRTALARALVSQPRILLLDEPFAALDSQLQSTLRDELDRLQTQLQIPMILISHDHADAERFGERIIKMRDGTGRE